MTALASQQSGRPGLDLPAMLKEAGVTALIALALTFPLVGLRTVDVGSRLTVSPRFTEVAIAVALVFIGRIGLILTREKQALPVLVQRQQVQRGAFEQMAGLAARRGAGV